jgi:hypothetical protein
MHAAQLIYENAIAHKTEVIVSGTWTKPPVQWWQSVNLFGPWTVNISVALVEAANRER